ncbi:hypothetical protein PQR08_29135 [Caballeronia jiangsuensis]|uniref:Uncharacterized protein n=1 Tax=Caballeronia jiangsuensis TaxID=1458357 RepID=A0ABW9CV58_9BURK
MLGLAAISYAYPPEDFLNSRARTLILLPTASRMTLTTVRIASEGKPYWRGTEFGRLKLIHSYSNPWCRRMVCQERRDNTAAAAALHEQNITARPLEIPVLQPILDFAQAVAPAVRRAACFDLFARGTADELERVSRFVFLLVQRRK